MRYTQILGDLHQSLSDVVAVTPSAFKIVYLANEKVIFLNRPESSSPNKKVLLIRSNPVSLFLKKLLSFSLEEGRKDYSHIVWLPLERVNNKVFKTGTDLEKLQFYKKSRDKVVSLCNAYNLDSVPVLESLDSIQSSLEASW